jgi:hypothetical protein
LIYPGFVILLDRASGRLTIGGAAERPGGGGAAGRPGDGGAAVAPGATKLEPRIRSQPLDKDVVPSIPAALIEPFLNRPLIVEPDGLDNAPTIIGTQTDRVILSAGNAAYVRGIADAKQDTWYVYRRGVPLVDPDTNQTLAYEAIYLGTAQITRPGDPATVVLTTAVQEVEAGDKLVAAARPQSLNYLPHAPTSQIRGRIMGIYGGVSRVGEAGPQSIITINRGTKDGLEVGHVLALYARLGSVRDRSKPEGAKDARIELPNERAGLAFVFRAFDRVSYALIMQLTRPVGPLDVVQTP